MTDTSTLLSDQVFQLNTFLWALEDLPDESQIQPVLRQAGYYLGSIGRSVLMPSGERAIAALTSLTGSADRSPCRPDLWLRHSSDPVQPIVELKARGFSPDSSNRRQALKLIAASFNLAPSLAEPGKRPGHVLYATTAGGCRRTRFDARGLGPIPRRGERSRCANRGHRSLTRSRRCRIVESAAGRSADAARRRTRRPTDRSTRRWGKRGAAPLLRSLDARD